MQAVGRAIGTEARSIHNDLYNKSGTAALTVLPRLVAGMSYRSTSVSFGHLLGMFCLRILLQRRRTDVHSDSSMMNLKSKRSNPHSISHWFPQDVRTKYESRA